MRPARPSGPPASSFVPHPTRYAGTVPVSDALSGGSNRATALSLNACPYLANLFFHHRPRFHSMGATCILTRGDNGSTLKPTTTALAMLQWLGVKPS